MRRNLLVLVWFGACLLVIFFTLRLFVADIYRVESGSMEPTLFGGAGLDEWVLVRYDGAQDLQRFELAVAYGSEGPPIVKRVAGLPGERIQLIGGDLFLDGSRLSMRVPRAKLVALFDSHLHTLFDEFDHDEQVCSQSDGGWMLDSRERLKADDRNLLVWKSGFDDGYLIPDGKRLIGTRKIRDGGVDFNIELLEACGRLRIDLREEGDDFRASVEWSESTKAGQVSGIARLERFQIVAVVGEQSQSTRLSEPELLREVSFELDGTSPIQIHFSNVDNGLLFTIGEGVRLTQFYASNRSIEGLSVAPGRTIGSQVALGGEGLHLRLVSLRVSRDLSWVPQGDYGVDRPIDLGPGEYFLLGDNSAHSQDGRIWGATPASDLLGRPVKVVWPLDRQRSLVSDLWRRLQTTDNQ